MKRFIRVYGSGSGLVRHSELKQKQVIFPTLIAISPRFTCNNFFNFKQTLWTPCAMYIALEKQEELTKYIYAISMQCFLLACM